jgi:3'(2'),5'-bisphosphate nucleotidase
MLIDALIELALKAGAEIMRFYKDGAKISHKADASPVTEADEAAEAIILLGLSHADPDVAIVAEEAVSAGKRPELSQGADFYLVDPLDGTKEFISKNGEFTVNIAKISQGVPTLGVVYAPALGVIYYSDGQRAYRAKVIDHAMQTPEIIHVHEAQSTLIAVGSRSHSGPETEDFLQAFPIERYQSAGSSLKFCLVAEGKADLYPRLGRTMQWDIAAAHAVLKAAGGEVVRTDLVTPMTYGQGSPNTHDMFANTYFVALGDADKIRTLRS